MVSWRTNSVDRINKSNQNHWSTHQFLEPYFKISAVTQILKHGRWLYQLIWIRRKRKCGPQVDFCALSFLSPIKNNQNKQYIKAFSKVLNSIYIAHQKMKGLIILNALDNSKKTYSSIIIKGWKLTKTNPKIEKKTNMLYVIYHFCIDYVNKMFFFLFQNQGLTLW
jgi:hypothetical protein